MAPKQPSTILPSSVSTRIDVAHLGREVEAVEDFLAQATLRKAGTAVVLPRTSRLLEELVAANGLNLLQSTDRANLAKFLSELQTHAPVMHFSFAAEPTAVFLQRLVEWLRTEIHPLVLIDVGLQPTLAAGCILRTNSKYFDLSLRQFLRKQQPKLIELMRQPAPEQQGQAS